MNNALSRRDVLKLTSAALPVGILGVPLDLSAAGQPSSTAPISDPFPSHDPKMIQETVLVSHFNLKRVKELVDSRPALARAAWDWGFGDWESALGAASHMGNRPIAEYLLAKGARPTLFSAAMLGQLDVVKAFIAAQPGAQRIRGPHSIPLLAHAKFGGAAAKSVFDYLQSLGDAGADSEPALAESDRALLLGTYIFGTGPTDQIDIAMVHNAFMKTDDLTWTRKGTMGRPLYHLGDRVFYPAGAQAVRISFTPAQQGGATLMTVTDGHMTLTVFRKV